MNLAIWTIASIVALAISVVSIIQGYAVVTFLTFGAAYLIWQDIDSEMISRRCQRARSRL